MTLTKLFSLYETHVLYISMNISNNKSIYYKTKTDQPNQIAHTFA